MLVTGDVGRENTTARMLTSYTTCFRKGVTRVPTKDGGQRFPIQINHQPFFNAGT